MNLKSKFKKFSILSVVAMNTLLLSGGLTTNAVNPQSSNGPMSSTGTLMQSRDQSSVEPVIIFVPRVWFYSRASITGFIPQVINFSSGSDKSFGSSRIIIPVIGSVISVNEDECIGGANEIKILAFISKESCSSNKRYIYIPQLVNQGENCSLVYVSKKVDFIGMPISADDNPALKILQQFRPSGSSRIIESQILSEQTKQTNCVTPKKNKLSAKEMERIGSLAPRPVRRHIWNLSSDEIQIVSKKLDFSQDESEIQNTSFSPLSVQSEQKNYVISERNKLNLRKSVLKSNGVQKTTIKNSQKPIHREAKKIVENNSPIYINLSDSQSDIETDIDTDIEGNSDYNKK